MDLHRIVIVLPCETLGDFPTSSDNQDAQRLLAAWTASWRPELLTRAGSLPEIICSSCLPAPKELKECLLLIPDFSRSLDVDAWRDRVRLECGEQTLIIETFQNRSAVIAQLQERQLIHGSLNPLIAQDFYALAYAYLQVELLTHHLQYASVIQPQELAGRVMEAARAALESDLKEFEQALRPCYDLLEQAREHTYASDIHLLDVVLVGPTTTGDQLTRELDEPSLKNYLLSIESIERLATDESGPVDRLRNALSEGRASVIAEGDLPGLSPEGTLRRLRTVADLLHTSLGVRPSLFGGRHLTFTPRLPSALNLLGFDGALLCSFDGQEPPAVPQSRISWAGIGGLSVEAVSGPVMDSGAPGALLSYCDRLSETLGKDFVATLILAGWAGRRDEFYDDLRCVSQRSHVLGKFERLDQYLESTPTDDAPWRPQEETLRRFQNREAPSDVTEHSVQEDYHRLANGLAQFVSQLRNAKEPDEAGLAAEFTRSLGQSTHATASNQRLIANAWSFERTLLATPGSAIALSTPGMGYRIVEPSRTGASVDRAKETMLQNEIIRVVISTVTGGIRSIQKHGSRWNLCSQRLVAYHDRSWKVIPTETRVESIETIANTSVQGALRISGRIVNLAGLTLARFERTCTLIAQSRALLQEIFLEQEEENIAGPSSIQWGLSTAWGEGPYHIECSNQWARSRVESFPFTTTEYVHLDRSSGKSLTLAALFGWKHRIAGPGRLESQFPPGPDSQRRHRYAIGIDCRYPLRLALDLVATSAGGHAPCRSVDSPASWALHLDAANVILSHMAPLPGPARRMTLRLMETEGRHADVRLRLAVPIIEAWYVGRQGTRPERLELDQGVARIAIGPYGWLPIEMAW